MQRTGYRVDGDVPVVTPALEAEAADLRADVTRLLKLQASVSIRSRDLGLRLRAAGLNNTAIAGTLGISKQRVSQLLPSIRHRREP